MLDWFKRRNSENNPAAKSEGDKSHEAFVEVYDLESGSITRIPARELAPGMVQAQIEGREGTVWIGASQATQSELRHPPFEADVREMIREIQTSIEEVYPLSFEEWEDGFRRDTNPRIEIAIWLHMARLYRKSIPEAHFDAEQRREIFQLLVACMNSSQEHVFHVFSPTTISREKAQIIVQEFYHGYN